MSAISVFVLVGYASLVVEVVLWPVPSVASTYQLLQSRRATGSAAFARVASTLASQVGFFLPLAFVFVGTPAWALPFDAPALLGVFAATCIVVGRVVTMFAVRGLRRAGRSASIVTTWPFTWSRNPAVVGLHVFLLGACLAQASLAVLLGFVVYVVHMDGRVRIEEEALTATHGSAYLAYKARVRRYAGVTRSRRVPP